MITREQIERLRERCTEADTESVAIGPDGGLELTALALQALDGEKDRALGAAVREAVTRLAHPAYSVEGTLESYATILRKPQNGGWSNMPAIFDTIASALRSEQP